MDACNGCNCNGCLHQHLSHLPAWTRYSALHQCLMFYLGTSSGGTSHCLQWLLAMDAMGACLSACPILLQLPQTMIFGLVPAFVVGAATSFARLRLFRHRQLKSFM